MIPGKLTGALRDHHPGSRAGPAPGAAFLVTVFALKAIIFDPMLRT
jgi:hypothetical protein